MFINLLKNKIFRYLKNYLFILLQKIKLNFKNKNINKSQINFITEGKNWSIKWDGEYIKSAINKNLEKELVFLSDIPTISNENKVYHFGSQYMWLDWNKFLSKKNKYIVSFLHGKPDDSPEVKKHIEDFLKTKNSIFKIITASSLVYQRLLSWGIEEKKISLIPIGVDTDLFNFSDSNYKSEIRSKLGFKKREFVIGSFQKDGIGWSKGFEPKLIKGPDLFVKAIELIAKELEVAVLLTGPSRGYVKKELTKRNIKFKHIYIDSYEEIAKYYQALDLYIVSSREEGGPKAIVESMASGIPIISTDVGMARDFLINNYNGTIIKNFDYQEIAKKSIELLNDPYKKQKIVNARKEVMKADWKKIAKSLWETAYLPAIKELNNK
tara:strand:+ start:47923 stop:49065 length:1143 start_codon:yes stop_codon:yes gene_type:complete